MQVHTTDPHGIRAKGHTVHAASGVTHHYDQTKTHDRRLVMDTGRHGVWRRSNGH